MLSRIFSPELFKKSNLQTLKTMNIILNLRHQMQQRHWRTKLSNFAPKTTIYFRH